MSQNNLKKILETCTEIYNSKGLLAVNDYRKSLKENGEIDCFQSDVLKSFENYLGETCTGKNRFRHLPFDETRSFLEKNIFIQSSYS